VFDVTANALCGMVVRGGMNDNKCEIYYTDALDLIHLVEAIRDRAPSVYYLKPARAR
jgi:hypothetical protein